MPASVDAPETGIISGRLFTAKSPTGIPAGLLVKKRKKEKRKKKEKERRCLLFDTLFLLMIEYQKCRRRG